MCEQEDIQVDTKELRELLERATPGPWKLATSCSWRRIVTTKGGAVIVPTIQRSDNHPDLDAGTDHVNAELAVSAVNALPALLDAAERCAALEAELAGLRADAERHRWVRRHCDVIEACDETIVGWMFQNNGATKLDDWIDRRAASLLRVAEG